VCSVSQETIGSQFSNDHRSASNLVICNGSPVSNILCETGKWNDLELVGLALYLFWVAKGDER